MPSHTIRSLSGALLLPAVFLLTASGLRADVFAFNTVAAPPDPLLPGGDNRTYVSLVITVPPATKGGQPVSVTVKALVDSGYTGGLEISPGLASQLGVDTSKGTTTQGGGAGGATTDTEVNLPTGSSTTIGNGSTPAGQTATPPTLPTTVSVSDFSQGTKADAIIGKEFLNQFASKGDASGTKGNFYYLIAPNEKTTGLAKLQTLINAAPPPLGPDGRPTGVLVKPIVPTPPLTPPPGSNLVPLDTGFNVDALVSDPITGLDVSQSFLIKSGSDRTLISEAVANALGIDIGNEPLNPTVVNSSLLSLPTANLQIDLFPGSPGGSFVLSVGILPDSLNPFDENYLGSDALNRFSYFEIESIDNLLYAVPVPEPAYAPVVMVLLTILAVGLSIRKRRASRACAKMALPRI